jgi:ureidoacrylate peracid hydrolase
MRSSKETRESITDL